MLEHQLSVSLQAGLGCDSQAADIFIWIGIDTWGQHFTVIVRAIGILMNGGRIQKFVRRWTGFKIGAIGRDI